MKDIIEQVKKLNFINVSIDENANKYFLSCPYTKESVQSIKAIEDSLMNIASQEIQQTIFKNIIKHSSKSIDINIDSIYNKKIRENKLKKLFGEELLQEITISDNTQTLSRILYTEIYKKINGLNANVIITNANIASALQDSVVFISENSDVRNVTNIHHYNIGKIMGCDVYVDSYMKYNDNKIYIGYVDYDLSYSENINIYI